MRRDVIKQLSRSPECYKVSVITALLRRVSLSTSEKAKQAELVKITKDLISCGYPLDFINKVKSKFNNTLRRTTNNSESIQPKYRPLPYVPGLSEILKRKLAVHGISVYFVTNPIYVQFLEPIIQKQLFLKPKMWSIKFHVGTARNHISVRPNDHLALD